jgi:hypothetical protein
MCSESTGIREGIVMNYLHHLFITNAGLEGRGCLTVVFVSLDTKSELWLCCLELELSQKAHTYPTFSSILGLKVRDNGTLIKLQFFGNYLSSYCYFEDTSETGLFPDLMERRKAILVDPIDLDLSPVCAKGIHTWNLTRIIYLRLFWYKKDQLSLRMHVHWLESSH